ncbi:hypothetical protein HOU02_gp193 [Caulobacter phage CcrBL9]|uniref:Uncharacterized protein n=1 Tax=Caulobacter phage CcrBL9 TaxID=2283270 RepID=A0A385EFA8_9CAUD|nr:hypothetical protein HOU02_gp193 [Caulobacter phage CcrBL9]AXQ69532.1 hypothetical protein CcrBL9_gp508 [Caulobacter phage CcrBL9]
MIASILIDLLAIAAGVYGATTGAVQAMESSLDREPDLLVALWVFISLGSAAIASLGAIDLFMRLLPAS